MSQPKTTIMAVVMAIMVSVFIGAIFVNEFEGVIDDQRPTSSLDFNNTADDIVAYTWIVFVFLALGILVVGGSWILNLTKTLG